ncbi:MAG: FtsX-like permease family protein, partial [Lachnospiraceae bacterium]|nr:FtsX-like permease family protein [Lachnospiraceae bacterium]
TISDQRMQNQSVQGANYSFKLFLYGFLFLIAMVTICNIVNCTAMSAEARMNQYGALRAIGMSDGQLAKMIVAETVSYAAAGGISGTILGLFLNKKLYEFLVTYRWNDPWQLPVGELCLILVIVAVSVILAIYRPVKKIQEMSIIETTRWG